MKLTQGVRDNATKMNVAEPDAIQIGLRHMAKEFAVQGGSVYQSA
jgi:hypothetical protein